MRIRKGQRCLPLAPADRSFLQESSVQAGKDVGMIDDRKDDANQAELMPPVALAAPAPVADLIGGRPPQSMQEHANDTFSETNECLEHDPKKHRVSADDNFKEGCLILGTGVDSTTRKPTETPPMPKSVFTRHKRPLDTTGTICSNTSAIESEDQPDAVLEQSLRQICSTAGTTGLSARDAVAQIVGQGLPGLNEGGERLIVQVAKLFRNSAQFVEREERGRYFLQESPGREENMPLLVGDQELSPERNKSTNDIVEAARQLQNLQKSHDTNSLGSGVVEPSESPSFHGGNIHIKADQDMTSEVVRLSKDGTCHIDVKEKKYKAISSCSPSRSQRKSVTQIDQPGSQCKRDDGKGWRCSRLAEAEFTMCNYHREQIYRAQYRRKRAKYEVKPTVSAKNSPPRFVANARVVQGAITTDSSWSPFLDGELAHDERRQFVKAKSLKSLLLKKDVQPIIL